MRCAAWAFAALLACGPARALEGLEFKASATAVSNYIHEGTSMSWNRPALQAEFEVEHDLGAYAGVFASTISSRQFPGGNAEIESWIGWDYEFSRRASIGVELAYAAFPGANLDNGWCAGGLRCAAQSFDTALARVIGRWDWLTLQLGYSLSDYYGASAASGFAGSTRGSTRLEATAEHELPWDPRGSAVLRVGYLHYASAFLTPVLPGVDGSGADYSLVLRRRFDLEPARLELQLGVAGTSRGVTARSLTDDAQARLGGPAVFVGITLGL